MWQTPRSLWALRSGRLRRLLHTGGRDPLVQALSRTHASAASAVFPRRADPRVISPCSFRVCEKLGIESGVGEGGDTISGCEVRAPPH